MSVNSIQAGNNSITSGLAGAQSTKSSHLTDAATQISSSFSDYLNQLSDLENNSDNLLQQLAAGEDVDLHQIMIATTETDVSFRVAMAIRDKLVDAYKEVMRMTV